MKTLCAIAMLMILSLGWAKHTVDGYIPPDQYGQLTSIPGREREDPRLNTSYYYWNEWWVLTATNLYNHYIENPRTIISNYRMIEDQWTLWARTDQYLNANDLSYMGRRFFLVDEQWQETDCSLFFYNDDGQMSRVEAYQWWESEYQHSEPTYRSFLTYQDGLLSGMTDYYYNEGQLSITQCTYLYDAQGRIIQYHRYDILPVPTYMLGSYSYYYYNDLGRLDEIHNYVEYAASDMEFVSQYLYEYNAEGRISQTTFMTNLFPGGQALMVNSIRRCYIYNQQGQNSEFYSQSWTIDDTWRNNSRETYTYQTSENEDPVPVPISLSCFPNPFSDTIALRFDVK
ncbi:MAG: hypothetical protein U1C33_05460, partial [Candidatus Cloacimonadaceae bacterium]|nr:hypothetical protein [Candidatus Cloacimonadaceae bacterium]